MKVKWRKSGKKSLERRILCPDNALGGGGGWACVRRKCKDGSPSDGLSVWQVD
jgi:hypothetical protein